MIEQTEASGGGGRREVCLARNPNNTLAWGWLARCVVGAFVAQLIVVGLSHIQLQLDHLIFNQIHRRNGRAHAMKASNEMIPP